MSRAISHIMDLIDNLEINLSQKVVITELATNAYFYAALIPLFSKAKKVIFLCKISDPSSYQRLVSSLYKIVLAHNLQSEIVIRKNNLTDEDLREVNILCNAGAVRPINKEMLKNVTSSQVVISLMYDAWEIRSDDIDLKYCRDNNIPIVGTRESNSEFDIFFNVVPLILKMTLECSRIYNETIFIYSKDNFGKYAFQALANLAPKKLYIDDDIDVLKSLVQEIDLLILCNYENEEQLIGKSGILNFISNNPNIKVVHLFGSVDFDFIVSNTKLTIFPPYDGFAKKMSKTFSFLGDEPVLDLYAASYKAATSYLNNDKCVFTQKVGRP